MSNYLKVETLKEVEVAYCPKKKLYLVHDDEGNVLEEITKEEYESNYFELSDESTLLDSRCEKRQIFDIIADSSKEGFIMGVTTKLMTRKDFDEVNELMNNMREKMKSENPLEAIKHLYQIKEKYGLDFGGYRNE